MGSLCYQLSWTVQLLLELFQERNKNICEKLDVTLEELLIKFYVESFVLKSFLQNSHARCIINNIR